MENVGTKSKKARYVKPVMFTVSTADNIERDLNQMIDKLTEAGGKIIAITPHTFGLSPMTLIYNIIYESDHALTKECETK